MRPFLRKTLLLFAVALLAALLFGAPKRAQAATPEEVTQKVMTYWNTVTSNGTQKAFWNKHYFANTLIEQSNKGDYLSQITRSPCSVRTGAEHLYVNGCSSNNWYGYSQCWGFTVYMGWLTTGAVTEGPEYGTKYYSVSDSFHFQPGDHIRYGWRENGTTATHSLFIYKVENGTVYTIECNWGEYCKIGLRSFSESAVRGFVNRFNSGDNSDFVFRPYSVAEAPKPVIQDWTDAVYNIAGGFKHGEGQNAEKTAFYLTPSTVVCKNGSSFTLSRENALKEIPNGFYLESRFVTKDISGRWEWYDYPKEIKQIAGKMEFGFWYYPIGYRITYELAGGKNSPNNPDSYNVLYGVNLDRPSKYGYAFTGWTLNGEKVRGINYGCDASFASSEEMIRRLAERMTGDVTLTAHWRELDLGQIRRTVRRAALAEQLLAERQSLRE